MALPLLMLAGAGMLGGAQYLLGKMDEKREEGLLSKFREEVVSSPLARSGMADGYLSGIEDSANSSNLLRHTSGETQSLINNFRAADMQYQQNQQQLYLDSEKAAQEAIRLEENDIQQDTLAARQRYSTIQSASQNVIGMTESGEANGYEMTAAIQQWLGVVTGGEIVSEGDIRAAADAGGPWAVASRVWSQIMDESGVVRPEDLQNLQRSVHRLGRDAQRQYDIVNENMTRRIAGSRYRLNRDNITSGVPISDYRFSEELPPSHSAAPKGGSDDTSSGYPTLQDWIDAGQPGGFYNP